MTIDEKETSSCWKPAPWNATSTTQAGRVMATDFVTQN